MNSSFGKKAQEAMKVRRSSPRDREALFDVWVRSVRATHAFLSEDEIESLIPHVRTYFSRSETVFWIACDGLGTAMGFMGVAGSKMESLFIAPEFQRRGVGRRLVEHAQALHGELTVDVNEENLSAQQFYEACGFVVEGRSALDEQGNPHPLLHLRLRVADA